MKFKKIDPLKDEDGFYNNVVELANNGNTKQAVNLVMKYIPDFIRVKSPLVTKLYNVTGNVCLYSGNYALAIDYYRRGLVYCEKMNDVKNKAMIISNIGTAYMWVHDYDRAIEHFKQAVKILTPSHKYDDTYQMIISQASLGVCLCRTGKFTEAADIAKLLEGKSRESLEDSMSIVCLFLCTYYSNVADIGKTNEYIDEMMAYMTRCNQPLYCSDDFEGFLEFLLDIKDYANFVKGYSIIYDILQPLDSTMQERSNVVLACRYCLETGNDDALYVSLEELYKYDCELKDEENKNALAGIDIRLSFENMERRQETLIKKKEKLKIKANTDELTGISNRLAFNNKFDKTFENAYKHKKMIAIDFFDIDNFKAYNDTYGHNEGNKCLSKISEVLSNFSNDKIFPARYGGDEFIILFSDMTVAEIREFAEKLRDAVSDLKIAHTGAPNGRFVTISQGIASAVPNESIKTWDLLRSADLNLYEVKQKGKGGIGCRAAERHDPR